MDDADPTGWILYRVAYSHEYPRLGWCVYEEADEHNLTFNCGPFKYEDEARAKMRELNESQGVKID